MAVPAMVDTIASPAWMRRKPVGPWWNERGSFQMLRTNVGQMIHVHTPKESRKAEADLESLMTQHSAGAGQVPACGGLPGPCGGHCRA